MRTTTRLLAILTGLALSSSACLDATEPDIGETSSAAWVPYWVDLWPFTDIEVCFAPFSPSGDPTWNTSNPAYIARTMDARAAIEDALASIPNNAIAPYGWGTCPPEELLDGWRISVEDQGNRASADIGYIADQATGVALGRYASMGALVHEFGHALGFQHEFMREDVSPKCTTGTGDGTETGHFLTPYDPASIMNGPYCPGQGYALTPSDKIAVAFLYPEYEPAMDVDYRFAFNGGYVVPESGPGAATYGWERGGILAEAIHTLYCELDGLTIQPEQLSSLLPSEQPVDLSCRFLDDWDRSRFTQPVAILKSGSKYAAVLTAVL